MHQHSSTSPPQTVLLARHAMRCRFELVLHGNDPVRLRAAGEEALDEIDRLEAALSLYRPTSEIAEVNRRAANGPVRVSPETFRLLQRAAELSRFTEGAFDITIAPLVRAWGFMGGEGQPADPSELTSARECVGMNLVELDPSCSSVRFKKVGVMLDLGAIGKGYAVDRAAETLRELGVRSALIQGGTSTVLAMGTPNDAPSWKIAVEYPRASSDAPPRLLAEIELHDESLSTSAVWGKAFTEGGKLYGHVLDPRTGQPAQTALLATVVARSAADSDALSTALLTLGIGGIELITKPGLSTRSLVVAHQEAGGGYSVVSRGIEVLAHSDGR
jgi:thiamine biosynthesis lipoprotein